jgi:hypothetical protein
MIVVPLVFLLLEREVPLGRADVEFVMDVVALEVFSPESHVSKQEKWCNVTY